MNLKSVETELWNVGCCLAKEIFCQRGSFTVANDPKQHRKILQDVRTLRVIKRCLCQFERDVGYCLGWHGQIIKESLRAPLVGSLFICAVSHSASDSASSFERASSAL